MKFWTYYLICVCFCTFLCVKAAQAQEWYTGGNEGGTTTTTTGDSTGNPTGSPEWSNGYNDNNGSPTYTASSQTPTTTGGNWEEQIMREYAQSEENVKKSLDRQAEESIYKSRGITMDFLNKPVELFKLTCTDSSGGSKTKLSPTFAFTKNIWGLFCKDSAANFKKGDLLKNAGKAAKCVIDQVLQEQFEKITKDIDKFKETSFCGAFTKFLTNQIEQCLTIRFDLPRGQFPGFPALNQCMFGRLNINVNAGKLVSASGQKISDVSSYHGFKYKPVGQFSDTGYGGSEQQLLGSDGAAALLAVNNWQKATGNFVAGSTCTHLDQDFIKLMDEYPPMSLTLIPGSLPNILGWKVASSGAKEPTLIAKWSTVFNGGSNSFDVMLAPVAGSKPGLNYLASCYGFQLDVENTTCANPKSESYQLFCAPNEETDNCCDPKMTNCLASGMVHTTDKCAKSITNSDGSTTCVEWAYRKDDIMLCKTEPPVCCNPEKNDCLQIGVNICPEFVPPKMCLTATPEQLAKLDPAYGRLTVRPAANQMIDGRVCCTTEWCNLCPQDLIQAAAGRADGWGSIIFLKTSDLGNVPPHCLLRPRNNTGEPGERNANLGTQLLEIPDAIWSNTEEACDMLMKKGIPPKRIYDILVRCPARNQKIDDFELTGSIAAEGIIKWAHRTFDDCPNNGELKPYSEDVINTAGGCSFMGDASNFPRPMEKVPQVEGADEIGLCSDLPLCPMAIPGDQDPLQGTGELDDLKSFTSEGIRGILNNANGTLDRPPGLTRFGLSPNNIRGGLSRGSRPTYTLPRVIDGSVVPSTRTPITTGPRTTPETPTTTPPTTTPTTNPPVVTGSGNQEAPSNSESWF